MGIGGGGGGGLWGGGGRSWLRGGRVEEVDLGGEACGVGRRWDRSVVRRKGVQGHERRKDGGIEVGFPEGGVLLQGEGVLCPFKSCGVLFQGRIRAQEGRICVAGGYEESCVHGIVRGNLDLFGFA
jgi:hypothetical protein